MSNNNICFYKEVDKSTLATKIDCALIGAYAVIRWIMEYTCSGQMIKIFSEE